MEYRLVDSIRSVVLIVCGYSIVLFLKRGDHSHCIVVSTEPLYLAYLGSRNLLNALGQTISRDTEYYWACSAIIVLSTASVLAIFDHILMVTCHS